MIWVIIQVEEGGLLDITQKLSKFGSDSFGQSSSLPNYVSNPFASPHKPNGDGSNPFSSPHKQNLDGLNPFASPHKPNFDGLSALNSSPNSSIVAQQGSPFSPHPLPSPTSSVSAQQGSPGMTEFSPISSASHQCTAPSMPAARSLFQV